MLESIGSVQNSPQFLQDVKDRKKKLMGFGHRVYKNYDPRAKIVKKVKKFHSNLMDFQFFLIKGC